MKNINEEDSNDDSKNSSSSADSENKSNVDDATQDNDNSNSDNANISFDADNNNDSNNSSNIDSSVPSSDGNDTNNQNQQNTQNQKQDKPTKFNKLSIIKTVCFGYSEYAEYIKKNLKPNDKDYKSEEELEKMKTWTDMIDDINSVGWSKFAETKLEAFENSLKDDIERSYRNIAVIDWMDASTQTKWTTKYVNDKMLWRLSISDSPNANVLSDDNMDFFKSKKFIDHIGKLGDTIISAIKKFKETVEEHIENGELLNVDEVKLSDILFWTEEEEKSFFLTNFRTGQYINRR